MSERSWRDRIAHVADVLDLEQLDGLVNRGGPPNNDDEPSLQRLTQSLEEGPNNLHVSPPVPIPDPLPPPHPLVVPPHNEFDPHMFDLVPDPNNLVLFGVQQQHTPLTRAIREGKFDLAKRLITSINDPDVLNDGSLICALSTNASRSMMKRPRNLEIASLLLERGASPNMRSPNALDIPSETPFEVAINFYLALKEQEQVRIETRRWKLSGRSNDTMDFSETIGLSGEDWLDLTTLANQTAELVQIFIDHGGDVNLHTTNAGRTIFHEVMCAKHTDKNLVDKMITLGALVNLTDVHGTTPFMDMIRNTDRAVQTYHSITSSGKVRFFI